MADPPKTLERPPYEGERNPAGFFPHITNPGVTLVIGGNFNPVGHALFRMGANVGWIHVHRIYDFPDIIPAGRLREYLWTNNKFQFADVDVPLPSPMGALRKIEELRSKPWLWLVVPHNCVHFCEQIIQAGGGDWSSISNLPYLTTFLDPWKTEAAPRNFQAGVVVEGPDRLSKGKSGVYTVKTIGLPDGGVVKWWPTPGEEERNGLFAVQMSYRQITVRATRDSGTSDVIARYSFPDKTSWAGRIEVALHP